MQLVEKPKDPEVDYVPGIVWQRNVRLLFPLVCFHRGTLRRQFRNVNTTLLREGLATCHDYDIPALHTMETRLPRMWRVSLQHVGQNPLTVFALRVAEIRQGGSPRAILADRHARVPPAEVCTFLHVHALFMWLRSAASVAAHARSARSHLVGTT